MTAKSRTLLKQAFENGDKPQGSDFEDAFDSFVSLTDATAQTMTSDLSAPKLVATQEVSAPNVNASAVSTNTLGISGEITYTGETTVAAIASGSVTLPASAAGYILVIVSGRTVALPYYRVS